MYVHTASVIHIPPRKPPKLDYAAMSDAVDRLYAIVKQADDWIMGRNIRGGGIVARDWRTWFVTYGMCISWGRKFRVSWRWLRHKDPKKCILIIHAGLIIMSLRIR